MNRDKGDRKLRSSIAREAARLMYEEDVKQYFTAKRIAARRLCGRVGGKRLRYRPADLPSNGEIRDALLELAELAEGARRGLRLFAMRITALEAMKALEPFSPRLIGSVSTGHVRRGSDIDLHVFTDDEDALFAHLRALRWVHEVERVSILKFGKIRDYLHVHVADVFAVELTVYERRELRLRPRSSTDGKPIDRISPRRLEALLAAEHPEPWSRYLQDGTVDGLADALEAEDDDSPRPGPFDGLLLDQDPPELLYPGDLDDPDELYDPLLDLETGEGEAPLSEDEGMDESGEEDGESGEGGEDEGESGEEDGEFDEDVESDEVRGCRRPRRFTAERWRERVVTE